MLGGGFAFLLWCAALGVLLGLGGSLWWGDELSWFSAGLITLAIALGLFVETTPEDLFCLSLFFSMNLRKELPGLTPISESGALGPKATTPIGMQLSLPSAQPLVLVFTLQASFFYPEG